MNTPVKSDESKAMKIYCLMFPGAYLPYGDHEEIIARGTKCATRAEAETLLSDRVANGEAFSYEYVALVRCQHYADATGDRSVLMVRS
jgi:hypothetical protein